MLASLLMAMLMLLNNFDREQMRQYYLLENARYMQMQYDGGPLGSDWIGDIDSCDPGTVSPRYQAATFGVVNYYRAICGLPPVTEDPALSEKCRWGALIMKRNNILRHDPPSNLPCWTQEGYDAAANSDVAMTAGMTAIEQYVEGSWAHRGWVLFPPSITFGTGSVGYYASGANCLWVFGQFDFSIQPFWEYVAYPPPGYAPYQILPNPNDWSFSLKDANFSNSTVSVKVNGSSVSTTIIAKNPYLYGYPSIVFRPSISFTAGNSDKTVSIKISNVNIGGQNRNYEYTTIIFDPGTIPTWKGNNRTRHRQNHRH